MDFHHSHTAEPHIARTKEIISKYPEIKQLMGRNPNTFYYTFGIVIMQVIICWFMRDQPWWVVLLVAYCIGAFANHALFVLMHDCLLYTSPSPRDQRGSRMPSSA